MQRQRTTDGSGGVIATTWVHPGGSLILHYRQRITWSLSPPPPEVVPVER